MKIKLDVSAMKEKIKWCYIGQNIITLLLACLQERVKSEKKIPFNPFQKQLSNQFGLKKKEKEKEIKTPVWFMVDTACTFKI